MGGGPYVRIGKPPRFNFFFRDWRGSSLCSTRRSLIRVGVDLSAALAVAFADEVELESAATPPQRLFDGASRSSITMIGVRLGSFRYKHS
jgi:hypothetical protein